MWVFIVLSWCRKLWSSVKINVAGLYLLKNPFWEQMLARKSLQKNPGMGQGYIAVLFCIAMVLISMGPRLWKSFRDMDEGVTHVLGITCSPYLLCGATKGEKHLLISVKLSQLTSSSLLYFKLRPYFSELSMGSFFCGLILVFSHRCCSSAQNQSCF